VIIVERIGKVVIVKASLVLPFKEVTGNSGNNSQEARG
jgi:hypothetical protein